MKQCLKCKKEFSDINEECPNGGRHNPDHLIGTEIDGKYRIEKCIGRGGMGAVYVAVHTKVNKKVAIKVILQSLIEANPEVLTRFEREALASARINHPHAVPVIDFGQTSDGLTYLVMEYVQGVPLKHILEKEKCLSPSRTVNLALQICSGISAAHNAGVIHRDLKPDNVMVEVIDNREFARVLDFGIAKLKDSQQTNITDTGALLGTPNYMSPEQCTGGQVDQRSDIYSLGIMLYQMLSGELPFQAQSISTVILLHVTKPPKPIRELNPSIPEPLARVVMRMLEKDPARRQQTVAEVMEQLEASINPDANQWRVVFNGLLDNSNAARISFFESVQHSFNLSAYQAEQLLDSKGVSVKKTSSLEEANKIAEKFRSLGAKVEVESIITELDLGISNGLDDTVADPLVVTNNYEMLSYARTTGSFPETKENCTEPNNTEDTAETATLIKSVQTEKISPSKTEIESALWVLEIDGTLYEDISETDLEAWIYELRIQRTDKVRKGQGQWYEIGKIPRFRRIFDQIDAQTAATTPHTKTANLPKLDSENRAFLIRMAKIGAVIFAAYIGISFGLHYYQYLVIKNSIYNIFLSKKTTVATLYSQIQEVLEEQGVNVHNVHITANYAKQNASISIEYSRTLLFIPIKYQVKRENTNLKITMAHIAQIQEGDPIELVGVTADDIARYKQELAEKAAQEGNAILPNRPLNEADALILELRKCETGDCSQSDLIIKAARAVR